MQDTQATYFGKRESGIPLIGALPWGSHFCQFYQGRADLLEILVPYLQAGLQNNELCLWVVDGPQDVEEARQALTRAVPRFEEYVQRGQVEILSRDQWHSCDGQLVPAVVSRLDQAISRGFDGLRLACTARAEEAHGPGARDSADALCQYNVIAAFAYPRDRFDAAGLMEVVKNHRLALVRNAGRWEVIESSEAQSVKEALRRSEEKLHTVFANMSEGFAYHRIVLDSRGEPCDYVFLEVNEAFEWLTGLKREDLIGRRVTQVLAGIERDPADWIGTYGKVALSGQPVQFENYSQALRKWYSVSAFSPHKGFFAVTFSDVTERKATEQALREANERLQSQAEELQTQAEELHAQAEELQASNEELREREWALRESEERYRRFFDEDLTGDFLAKTDGTILECNPAFAALYGFRDLAAAAQANLAGFNPEDWAGLMKRLKVEREIQGHQCVHRRPDGTDIHVVANVVGRLDKTGALREVKGYLFDDTKRKLAEEHLREAHERLLLQAEGLKAANDELLQNEQALRRRERRARLKLDSILSPQGDLGNLELADIIDAPAIQSLMDDFYRLAHVPMAVIDLQGRVLVGVGWQTICTKFHRVHPETGRSCVESDTQLTVGVAPGECRLYKCKNHMWDIATPLLVAGQHVGNLFSGQFFFDDEPLERDLFRAQAQRYGFDERDYLAALEAVPRLSRETIDTGMTFLMKLARMISQLSYSNIELARSLEERKSLMESLRQGQERLKRAQEIAHLGSWELDLVRNELTWSDEVYRIFGLRPREFGATYEAFLERVYPDDRAAVDAAYTGSLREGRDTYEMDHRVVRQDTGEIRIVHEKCEHFRDAAGRVIRSVGMVHDITERKRAEEQLLKLNRTLQALSNSSQALMHATEESAYLQNVCKIVVEDCGHALVWIGYAEDDDAKSVRPVAYAGFEEGYLEALHVTWADTERGRGPTGTAIRTGRPYLCRNMLADPNFAPWRRQALQQGYASSIGLPLTGDGRTFGAITIYSREPDPFAPDDVDLLMELASDLAQGITSLRLRAAHAQAEEALRESEARLRLAQNAAKAGTWEWDLPTGRNFWSEELWQLYGLEPHSCVPSYEVWRQTMHPEDRSKVEQSVQEAARREAELNVEWRVRDRQGQDRWLMCRGQPVRDAQGRSTSYRGIVLDITDRKRAEDALRESEQRLRLALEGGRMGRWEWDVPQDTSLWDPRFYELLGLDRRVPAASRILFAMIDERDRDVVQRLTETRPAGGGDFHVEFRVNRPRGEMAWLALRGKVVCDEQGQAARLMGVMNDITQRKQMEADLRRLNDQLEEEVQAQTEELKDTVDRLQEEVGRRTLAEETLRRRSRMLEAFFQHTIAPLAFMDRDFNFVRVNEAYAQSAGRSPEYFLGRNHFDLYPHDENRQIFEQVTRTKQPFFAFAKPLVHPEAPQRVRYWNWRLTPLLDEQGEVQFLVLNLEDVTQRQKAFQELEQRARQLQKLTLELSQAEDRERKRLAEILHDDLQQQLAAAKFHLSLLGRRISRDKAVQGAVEQLDQILKDAVEKSRSLSHELSPAVLYQGDLGETFEWLARQLKTKHGLTVHVESRGRIDPSSEALKVFFFRTAQEILFNIVKHARVREARLRLQRLRGGLWLTISDQGQGFDPRSPGKTGGFGLLSIRERTELLGGRMKIRSVPGRGSTFLIVVPDGEEPEDRGQTTEDGPQRTSLSSVLRPASSVLRVLLVDDHKVMREGLAALLSEQADLEVIGQAGNGREAVDLACRLGPDVVVMDVAMPLMAGEEATRQIKLQLPRARVVALSMFEEADMAEAMRQAGAEAYLLKTAPSDELLAAIRGRASPAGERP